MNNILFFICSYLFAFSASAAVAIPEPSSLALLGIAVVGLIAARIKKP